MKTLVLAAALAASSLLALAARAGEGAAGRHPHFDDHGTLSWSTRLDDARKRAKAEDKLIFIEFGREA